MKHNKSNRKVIPYTLVLGGGGARGLAHIGVLKSLEKNGLIPSLIIGTSMGAVVGAMYSQLLSAKAVEIKTRNFIESEFFKRIGLDQFSNIDDENSGSVWERFAAHLRQRYMLSKSVLGTGTFAQEQLLQSMQKLVDDADIRDLPIRFAAVTSDLADGEEHVLTSGSVVTAVTASSAVPGIIAPLPVDSHIFIDGTVTSTIPVPAALALSKDPIVAVDVRHKLDDFNSYRHGFEIVMRAGEITTRKLNDLHLKKADIILKPDVQNIEWNEFKYIDRCIQAGEEAVDENKHRLIRKLTKRPFRFFRW